MFSSVSRQLSSYTYSVSLCLLLFPSKVRVCCVNSTMWIYLLVLLVTWTSCATSDWIEEPRGKMLKLYITDIQQLIHVFYGVTDREVGTGHVI